MSVRRLLGLGVAVAVCAASAPAAAQAPTPSATYAYARDGRRDPFVPVVGRSPAAAPPQSRTRPEGVAGLLVSEIVVRGLLESQGTWLAMVAAPDGRTYTVRAGDALMDGTVRTITADAVVFLQDVGDPLSVAREREVRKYLRDGGEG
jgi:Tfp pilus assembly protein PilP